MKGIVFTEFLEMVEQQFSADTVDAVLDRANPPSGGAYTAVGTYPHSEMLGLVVALGAETGTPVPALVKAFGEYLFGRFVQGYPQFFTGTESAFQLLTGIESIIHTEVRKLYPDAELPSFAVEQPDDHTLHLYYRSPRDMGDLAEGLITACIRHYGTPLQLARTNQPAQAPDAVLFALTYPA